MCLPLLTACGSKEFTAASNSSLGAQALGDATGTLNQPGCDPSQQVSGTSTGYGGAVAQPCLHDAYYGSPGNDRINIWLLCTHHETSLQNFKKAYHDQMPIQLAINGNLCTNNRDTIRNMLMQPSVTIGQLRGICPSFVPSKGALHIELYVNNQATESLVQYTGVSDQLVVHWSSWKNAAEYEQLDNLCDQLKSPLVVELLSNKQPHKEINLTSKEKGVKFDLLGKQNDHKPVQISWFADDTYQMLALPDSKGEVHGIDQLFGDSTQGPDMKFADDGYKALAKYDMDLNGRIDKNDPIFAKLRLWGDVNKDGKGQRKEMTTLAKHQIEYIDLNFSKTFLEVDLHGNQLKQRSTVGFNDGSKGWIYDLWFRTKTTPAPSLYLTQK